MAITLSLLTIEVTQQLGLRLQGVGFPGHFLVKCPEQPGLSGGSSSTPSTAGNCWGATRVHRPPFRAVLHGRPFDPSLLDPVDSRHILTRMLHNLKRIYVERGDDLRTLWVVDRLLQISPDDLEERRDRGLVSARHCRPRRGRARPGLVAGRTSLPPTASTTSGRSLRAPRWAQVAAATERASLRPGPSPGTPG